MPDPCEAVRALSGPPLPPDDHPAGSDRCVLLDCPFARSQTCERTATMLQEGRGRREEEREYPK